MRSTEANWPMAHVRVFSSGLGSGETEGGVGGEHGRLVSYAILWCILVRKKECESLRFRMQSWKVLTFRQVIWAAGRVVEHRDADVLEVLSPLGEALALQTASPRDQLAVEQACHQVQATYTETEKHTSFSRNRR